MVAKSGAGARRKGAKANNAVVKYLQESGFHWIAPRQGGEDGDDVVGLRHVSIEVKDQVRLDLGTWLKQALASAARNRQMGCVWHKRKGFTHPKDWYVTFRGEEALRAIAAIEGVELINPNKETST